MTVMFKVTEAEIRQRAAEKSFSRGKTYYRNGSVFDTVLRGNQLEARCQGSHYQPYQVRVKFNAAGIENATCACEYDWGGDCKHIVAVLLTYINQPEKFISREPVTQTLQNRSKEALIELIEEMIERYPDLEMLVNRPTPTQVSPDVPVSTESFRYELRKAMQEELYSEDYWDNTVSNTVASIRKTAEKFAQAGNWNAAAEICISILDEFIGEDEYMGDDEGNFFVELQHTQDQLNECLEQKSVSENTSLRQRILKALIDIDIWDTNQGGLDVAPDAQEYVLRHAKKEDLNAIRLQVNAVIDSHQRRRDSYGHGSWVLDAFTDFLSQLDELDDVDPDIILTRLKARDAHHLVVEKLINMQRLQEALKVFEEDVQPHYYPSTIRTVYNAGYEDEAVQLAEGIVQRSNDYATPVRGWLMNIYKEQGNLQDYFRLLRFEMKAHPDISTYRELKAIGMKIGQEYWDEIRRKIINEVNNKKDFEALIDLYLDDKEGDKAWETLAAFKNSGKDLWRYTTLEMRVAEKTRMEFPEQALKVYHKHMRDAIGQRKRDAYQEAAECLAIMQELYLETDEEETWVELIEGIRKEFARLPALQDELDKAGL